MRMQHQLQNAESGVIANLAIPSRSSKRAVTFAARAGDEFADSPLRIRRAAGRLRSESLVVVVVARDHDIGMSIVKRLEKWLNL